MSYNFYDPEAVIQDADIEMAEMREEANYQAGQCETGDHGNYAYLNEMTKVESCGFCGKDIK